MKGNVTEILKRALELPPEARAAVAGALLAGLDEAVDRDAESAWDAEVVLRLKEMDEGTVEMVPWSKARDRIAGQK
ncbi:MAG: addiction module protein [Pseudomonadota bacterium]